MLVKAWQFITSLLTALLVRMTFCHVLELPAKMEYPASLYLTLHRTLYAAFGPFPALSSRSEQSSLPGVLVFLVRKHRPAFWLTLLGILFLAAGLAAYFAFVEPANVEMKGMDTRGPPERLDAGGTGGSTGTRPILSFILWDSARWSFR